MVTEELERICFNCNHFSPDKDEVTEYGICLDQEKLERAILEGAG